MSFEFNLFSTRREISQFILACLWKGLHAIKPPFSLTFILRIIFKDSNLSINVQDAAAPIDVVDET